VVRIEDPGPDEIGGPTGQWLDDIDLVLDDFRYGRLPRDFPFDFSAGSLAVLEPLVVAEWPADDDLRPAEGGFVRGALTYLGESLMRVAGGRWRWSAGPVVSFDPALRLPDRPLLDLVAEAVDRDDGEVFAGVCDELAVAVAAHVAADPGWEPVKLYTLADPVQAPAQAELDAWLRRQEPAFAAWSAGHPEGKPWDFSARSIEALERVLLANVPAEEVAGRHAGHPVVELASWYVGEAMIRNRGGVWTFYPGEPAEDDPTLGRPFIQSAEADKSFAVPPILVSVLLRRRIPGFLSRQFGWYVDR
jgi:hypothetical protein